MYQQFQPVTTMRNINMRLKLRVCGSLSPATVADIPIPIVAMIYHGLSHCRREAGEFLRRNEIAQNDVTVLAKLLAGEHR
jgi:hypothetical protein